MSRTLSGSLQGHRASGVLVHVTSLPTPYGIGDLGPAARQWIEMLAGAQQRYWQFLPLGPAGAGNSPYQCYSAFAGDPLLISPDLLQEDGLLDTDDLAAAQLPLGPVNYARVTRAKTALLERAWLRFEASAARSKLRDALARFETENAEWLPDYALFAALRETYPGGEHTLWPKPILHRREGALAEARQSLASRIERHAFWQFLFDRQLAALRAHARRHGVLLIGDLPIFVSANSADVWAHPQLFELDRHHLPTAVAGVPPDLFSADGQRWGNPLYRWPAMQRDDFAWWRRRFRATMRQCDLVRLDHFRGFDAYWRVPARSPTAARGQWVKAPGHALLSALQREAGGALPVIAEDLGVITPAVEKLRDAFELPGMRILQFAFGGDGSNGHLPHNFVRNCVVYTGTHDNDTTVGWYRSAPRAERQRLHDYAGAPGDTVAATLTRLAWTSIANLAIVPAQDLLSLPSAARMNTPGTESGNWRWRLADLDALRDPLARLADLTRATGRA